MDSASVQCVNEFQLEYAHLLVAHITCMFVGHSSVGLVPLLKQSREDQNVC